MLRRRSRRAQIIGSLVIGLLLAGCGSSHQDGSSDKLTAPVTGICRNLAVADLDSPSNASDPVSCARPHTAETFAIGVLPGSTGSSYDDKRHGRYVYDTCQKGFATYLGADESLVLRSRLSWAWFRPSTLGWERGARWFRCDVVGGPADATKLRDLPRTARGMFAQDLPDAWLTCESGSSVASGTKVPCSEPHTWRAVTTVKIGKPADPYPGDRIVEVLSRDYCRDSVRGALGYPPDFDYGYSWFRKDRWDGGNHRAICWSRTSQ